MRVFTIGHSTQPLEQFVAALRTHAVAMVADVRRFPASRRHPQFGKSELSEALRVAHIDYVHVPELGGRRNPRKDSHNTAWRSASFRGYADHMETAEFSAGMAQVLEQAAVGPVAVMCAELLWWQCHRGLIADYLKAEGHDVVHIVSTAKHEPHPYTSAARIVDRQLSYEGLL